MWNVKQGHSLAVRHIESRFSRSLFKMNFTLNALDLATSLAKLTRLLLWDVHALFSLLGPWSALIN